MQVDILVIDDSVTIQKVIRIALAHLPYHVHLAPSLGEGKDLVARSDFGLILADANLVDSRGVSDYEDLAKRANCPVILLVGSFEAVDEAGFARAGLSDIVRKPFEVGDIVSVCKKYLKYLDGAPARAAEKNQDGAKQKDQKDQDGAPAKETGSSTETRLPLPPPPQQKNEKPKKTLIKPPQVEKHSGPGEPVPPPLPPPPRAPVFSGMEATGSFTMSHLNAEIAQLRKADLDLKKPAKAYPDDSRVQEGPINHIEGSGLHSPGQEDMERRQRRADEGVDAPASEGMGAGSPVSDTAGYLAAELPKLVHQAVREYCDTHFSSLADQIIRDELRRLADDKTKLLSGDL